MLMILIVPAREMERVGKRYKYLCVESYRNEKEKQIFCIGRSPVKLLILPKSGIGGLITHNTMEISLSSTLNEFATIINQNSKLKP